MKLILLMLFLSFSLLYANIGKVVAISGDVQIKRGSDFITAKLKSQLEKFDTVITKNNARVQFVFQDNTMISVGKNSTFSVEDYLFDIGKKPKAAFKFGTGVFKTITGKIGKINPRGFKLKSKTASMGIRGTIVGLELSDQEEIYLVPEGKIELKIGNKTIILNAGDTVTKQRNKPVSRKTRISSKKRERFERRSGAKQNEKESGLGENSRTTSVNNVEKCNYR